MALAVRKPKVMVPNRLRPDLVDVKTEIAIVQYEYGFVPSPTRRDDETDEGWLDDQTTKKRGLVT